MVERRQFENDYWSKKFILNIRIAQCYLVQNHWAPESIDLFTTPVLFWPACYKAWRWIKWCFWRQRWSVPWHPSSSPVEAPGCLLFVVLRSNVLRWSSQLVQFSCRHRYQCPWSWHTSVDVLESWRMHKPSTSGTIRSRMDQPSSFGRKWLRQDLVLQLDTMPHRIVQWDKASWQLHRCTIQWHQTWPCMGFHREYDRSTP